MGAGMRRGGKVVFIYINNGFIDCSLRKLWLIYSKISLSSDDDEIM